MICQAKTTWNTEQDQCFGHTVPKAAQISEKYLGVYMGASPLAGKFPKAV